jgi:hypothetical protein
MVLNLAFLVFHSGQVREMIAERPTPEPFDDKNLHRSRLIREQLKRNTKKEKSGW